MNQKLVQKKQPPGNELQLQLLISSQDIEKRLKKIAKDLETHYASEVLTIVMVLKGSFILVADLLRHLHLPICLEAVQVKSYGEGGMVKGEQEILGLDALDFKDKNILLIDDIFDTGETLGELAQKIQNKGPTSFRSLVLLAKDVPHQADYRPDIVLFDIEDRFVVGYGLDYKEYYRGLPDIYSIEQ